MQRRYVTVDVFSQRRFGGNPLAVVLDAEGLTGAQMQSIAAEFNYAETTFVLPARAATNAAWVRIYTPRTEVPFAGHPNVGTAVVLAHERAAAGHAVDERFVFEEAAGPVPMRLLRAGDTVWGAEFTAPHSLVRGPTATVEDAASCLGLAPAAVRTATHAPQVLSVGLPFLVVELARSADLRAARPVVAAHARVLPPLGVDAIYAYLRETAPMTLAARMFAPLDGIVEDPATGSATAATLALLAEHADSASCDTSWTVAQGVEMGRPSVLRGRTERRADGVCVHVGGHVVPVRRGTFEL